MIAQGIHVALLAVLQAEPETLRYRDYAPTIVLKAGASVAFGGPKLGEHFALIGGADFGGEWGPFPWWPLQQLGGSLRVGVFWPWRSQHQSSFQLAAREQIWESVQFASLELELRIGLLCLARDREAGLLGWRPFVETAMSFPTRGVDERTPLRLEFAAGYKHTAEVRTGHGSAVFVVGFGFAANAITIGPTSPLIERLRFFGGFLRFEVGTPLRREALSWRKELRRPTRSPEASE